MHRPIAALVACCLFIAAAGLAQENKKISLKNGNYLIGVVKEQEGRYLIETKNGIVPVEKDQVLSIEEYVSPGQEYQRRLAEIDKTNPEDRFKLGQWAFDQGLMEAARDELRAALELKTDYERARLLLRRVEARIEEKKLLAEKEGSATQPRLSPASPTLDPKWLVTDDEIAEVRLAELVKDDSASIVFNKDVINRFVSMTSGQDRLKTPDEVGKFRLWPRPRQATYMMESPDADKFKADIVVKTDPRFMVDFRRQVWPAVSNYCATSDCHGGPTARGGFRLLNIAAKTVNVDYTNFLLIDGYQKSGQRMIDRDIKESSLLLQFGLPRDQAKTPHPVEIPIAYVNKRSANYQRVMKWLESLKGPPRPKYAVKLRVPWLPAEQSPATAPAATRPASAATP